MAAIRQEAENAFDHFVEVYWFKYPKAVACLEKDRRALLAFYDVPAEHGIHLRTTHPHPIGFHLCHGADQNR